ncbi:unnamed protein product [Pocillopora meandrina]|uniref:DDE Tnp4 domain-containing protein n=1 Tax=Pocillopora meandrina TaxID=46732 RepID=A0AAU9WW09_9CNID|nr:unnamed protein product [Pocillopora meandrina]
MHTRMRSPVSVKVRVGVALWRLATGDSFKSYGLQFGPGMSTAKIHPLIIGDSAYPLLKWLVKPYPSRGHLTPDEREFNEKLSAARSVVERVFGMLKGRWRLLLKEVEQQTRTLSKLFLLHVFHKTFVSITATCTISAIAIQMTVILTTIMKDHCARAAQK